MSAALARVEPAEIVDAELIDDYTQTDWTNDVQIIRSYGDTMQAINHRRQEIERAQTIAVARSLYRLRHDPESRWLAEVQGGKANTWRFSEWAGRLMGYSVAHVQQLLYAAETLHILESHQLTDDFPLPTTAGQIEKLSALRKLPAVGHVVPTGAEALVSIWRQAVEDAGGKQPKQQTVEAAVKQWKVARHAVIEGDLTGGGKVRNRLRRITAELDKIAETDRQVVHAWSVSIQGRWAAER